MARYNNIVEGRETWGAADQEMPRLLPTYYRNEADGDDDRHQRTGPGRSSHHQQQLRHRRQRRRRDPRLISNLISDMSFNNPAAIVAALSFAEFYGEWSGDVYGPVALLERSRRHLPRFRPR